MEQQVNNPVAIESKRRLVNALLALMEEKPYFKINIQELATRAGMDRRTFYRNFDSKEDVLKRYMDIFMKRYMVSLKNQKDLTIDKAVITLIDLIEEYKPLIILLNKSEIVFLLLDYINRHLETVTEIIQESSLYELEGSFEDQLAYNLGGAFNYTIRNIIKEQDITKDENE